MGRKKDEREKPPRTAHTLRSDKIVKRMVTTLQSPMHIVTIARKKVAEQDLNKKIEQDPFNMKENLNDIKTFVLNSNLLFYELQQNM